MKVKELIKTLLEFDGNLEVVIQVDSKGNGYHKLSGAETAKHQPEYRPSGDDGLVWYHTEVKANCDSVEDDQDCVVVW